MLEYFHIDNIMTALAVFASIIFLIQSVLFYFADFDFDFDYNGGDIGVNDFVSFTGCIHFLLGFSWTAVFCGYDTFSEILFAIFVGLLFVFGLGFLYKEIYSLAVNRTYQKPEEIIGQESELITFFNCYGKAFVIIDGKKTEVTIKGDSSLKKGDIIIIKGYIKKENIFIAERKNF